MNLQSSLKSTVQLRIKITHRTEDDFIFSFDLSKKFAFTQHTKLKKDKWEDGAKEKHLDAGEDNLERCMVNLSLCDFHQVRLETD